MRTDLRTGRVAMAAATIAVLALGTTACAKNTINTKSAQDAIALKLQTLLPESAPFTVTCPAEIVAKQGDTFTCSVKSADGTTFNVVGTQTDDKGTFDIKPETDLGSTGTTRPAG